MKAIDIVSEYNKYYQTKNPDDIDTHFILQKRVEDMHVIKSHKKYIYRLWMVNNGNKRIVGNIEYCSRSVTETEKVLIEDYMTKELLHIIFYLIDHPEVVKEDNHGDE
jgi:hypothetical protein